MVFVIGSGPAGVAAAHALVKQEVDVTMLDVGLELEPERQRQVDEMAATSPDGWKPETVAKLKEGMLATVGGIPQKLCYGSNFPFRDAGQGRAIEMNAIETLVSGARGGLSNAWGANFMPCARHDIADWCVSAVELAPHLAAVAEFVPVSASHDDLDEFFTLYGKTPSMLQPSRQATALLADLHRNKAALRAAGFTAGFSRLAVQVQPTETNPHGCVYCGLCMYGCPYRLIYSSASSVRQLQRNRHFRYVPGVIVEKLVESGDSVEIIARSRDSGEPLSYRAERVYLGSGVVSTTRILMESLQAYDTPVLIKDSQYFLLPMLRYRSTPGVMQEALHTLAQVYIELLDDSLSRNIIQLQFYTYNELYQAALRNRFGLLFPLMKWMLPSLLGRMSVILAYLHSNDSSAIEVRLLRDANGNRLKMDGRISETPRRVIEGVVRKLWRHRGLFRAVPMKPMLQVFPPGNSYHYGSSFPMRENPARFESDRWGRPAGLRRVHAVDATVLPSLTATTIVHTAMANAHRIASQHPSLL